MFGSFGRLQADLERIIPAVRGVTLCFDRLGGFRLIWRGKYLQSEVSPCVLIVWAASG